MKDFDAARLEREQDDRTFKIGGETFTHRPAVAPEAVLRWSKFASGDADLGENEWLEIIDETIVAMIEPEDREKWEKVRDPDLAHPLNLHDLQSLLQWLVGKVVGRPTGQPSGSSPGGEQTENGSTDGSSSPAEAQEVLSVST